MRWVHRALAVALLFSCIAKADNGDLRKLAEARYRGAEKAWGKAIFVRNTKARFEVQWYYLLSTNLLRAERDLHPEKSVQAFQAHYDRMTELEQRVKKQADGLALDQPEAASAFRLEAQYWLQKAKTKKCE